jgi:hypothetical protein
VQRLDHALRLPRITDRPAGLLDAGLQRRLADELLGPQAIRERRTIVCTRKWHSMSFVVMVLALLGVMALPARGDRASDGPKVGLWKTWVLASGTDIPVPAPPADTSDQTKAELAELRQLQKERSPITNTAIQYYNAVPATQRWHDLAFTLARAEKQSPNRQARLVGMLHTALHDAVIATWAAKYQFNRKPPSLLAPDVTLVVPMSGPTAVPELSYPSEHAALAGTAVGILTAFFPKEEANLKAMAASAPCSRRRQPTGSIWARRLASRVSMVASTIPAMNGLGTRWARASARWRSSAISLTGPRPEPGGADLWRNRIVVWLDLLWKRATLMAYTSRGGQLCHIECQTSSFLP